MTRIRSARAVCLPYLSSTPQCVVPRCRASCSISLFLSARAQVDIFTPDQINRSWIVDLAQDFIRNCSEVLLERLSYVFVSWNSKWPMLENSPWSLHSSIIIAEIDLPSSAPQLQACSSRSLWCLYRPFPSLQYSDGCIDRSPVALGLK